MPEGPELHLAARFVNKVCHGKIFSGKVVKSEVSTKNPDVDWNCDAYIITAVSRGKEVKLTLTAADTAVDDGNDEKVPPKKLKTDTKCAKRFLDIVFKFGMSGKFAFQKTEEMHKHSHLNFYTKSSGMVLSFVDFRRFGHWEPGGDWGKDRGPCVLLEYEKFRANVLDNLKAAAFNKPICEALLNQKYFNGIGNYLRAEILYRCGIPPFTCARDVLEPLAELPMVKNESPDILQLCHLLPSEVINLTGGVGYDPEADAEDCDAFSNWLQCYYNKDMSNAIDHNKRTIWFKGEPGPMAPKVLKTRGRKTKKNLDKKKKKIDVKNEEADQKQVKTETIKREGKKRTRKSVKLLAESDSKQSPASGEKTEKIIKRTKGRKRKSDATQGNECTEQVHSPVKTRRRTSSKKENRNIDYKSLVDNASPYFEEKRKTKIKKVK